MFCAYQLTLCYQQCQRLCLFTHSWDGHRNKVVISNAVGVIPKSLGHVGGYLNTKQNFVFQTVALNLGEVAAVVRAPEPFENKLCTSTSPPTPKYFKVYFQRATFPPITTVQLLALGTFT